MHPYAHSMTILRSMLEDPPPLAPPPTVRSLRETYDRFVRVHPLHVSEVEDAIVAYGRILWPYRKAFESLVRRELESHDLDALARDLPPELHQQLAQVRSSDRSMVELHDTIEAHTTFSRDDRTKLCEVLVAARTRSEAHVRARIAKDPEPYRALIREYQVVQQEIDQHLAALRRLAERVVEHDDLFREVLESVREFERGFAYLAREPAAREVCAAMEGYAERHESARRAVRDPIFRR